MSDLAHVDVSELRSRMENILMKVEEMFIKMGPMLKSLGDMRAEAHLIYTELRRRGVLVEDKPDGV